MKTRFLALTALILGSASIFSCINSDETREVIFQQNKADIEAYLEENPFDDAVKEYGLVNEAIYMFWETAVDGEINQGMKVADTVRVNYTGRLLSDKVFDSSIEQVAKDNGVYVSTRTYQPLKFPVGYSLVIPGFELAISLMKAGEKATIIFPSSLGYGSTPQSDIPANSPLIFEIELLEVKNGPNHTTP